jgi:putative ABC transport system permease protein
MSSIAMWHRSVLPNYHETMGIPLLAGRMLSTTDGPGAPNAIVVSQSFVEQIWPGESPLGKRIYKTGPVGEWTVVGVVGDVRHKTLGAPAEPTIYRTLSQLPSRRLYLVARTTGDVPRVLTSLQEAVWSQDPDTPITETGVMTSFMHDSEADDRFRAILMSTFAILAAILASVGIFGVTARSVSARTREIGIRAALGAHSRSLIILALREGAVGAGIGIGLGLTGVLWAAGLLRSLLYDVDPWDPVAYGLVAILMVLVCLVAVFIPARRAARVSVADAMGIE